jgi:3-oxoacyl-[acyl-carrier-protein] synthase III
LTQLIHSIACALGDKAISVRDEIEAFEGPEFAESFSTYTGIETAYLCSKDTLLDLACLAVSEALAGSIGVSRMIVVTQTFEPRCPGLGFALSSQLGLSIPILELNSACQGFVEAMILAGQLQGASLIVCADQLGSHVRTISTDKSVRYLFSDCASAVVVSGFSAFKNLIKPDLASSLTISAKEASMNGEAISFAASRFVPELLALFLKPSEGLFLHQANLAILSRIERRLKRKSYVSIQKFANTSSSSIPLGLADAALAGLPVSDTTLCGYGAGFAVSACKATLSLVQPAKILK